MGPNQTVETWGFEPKCSLVGFDLFSCSHAALWLYCRSSWTQLLWPLLFCSIVVSKRQAPLYSSLVSFEHPLLGQSKVSFLLRDAYMADVGNPIEL